MKTPALLISLLLILTACQPGPLGMLSFEQAPDTGVIDGQRIETRATQASKSVVLLELLDSEGFSPTFCTATLVGPHTILTAAHCFDKKLIKSFVSFRVVFTNTIDYPALGSQAPQTRSGYFYKNHPDYNSTGLYDHDIAVGLFKGDIPQGYMIAAMDTDASAQYADQKVYVYGYGKSRNYTGSPSEDLRAYSGLLNRGILNISSNYDQYADRYLVVPTSPSHICQGDSGGPQFYQNGDTPKIIGVTSANMGTVLPNGRQSCTAWSQATKVAKFYPWIKSVEKKALQ